MTKYQIHNGPWQRIEAIRQVRADHMVEIQVNGTWYLGCDLIWHRSSTLGSPAVIGEFVRIRTMYDR